MNLALNGNSEIQRFECVDTIEIRDGIKFVFYPGLPQMCLKLCVTHPRSYQCTLHGTFINSKVCVQENFKGWGLN